MAAELGMRATNREREETVEALRAAYAAGCLDDRELGERASLAYAAKARRELLDLLSDIPAASARAGEPPRTRPRTRLLAWGYWLLPAVAGTWLIAAAADALAAIPFILIWLAALWALGWMPRTAALRRGWQRRRGG